MSKAYGSKKPSHLAKLSRMEFPVTQQIKSNLARARHMSDEAVIEDASKDSDVAPILTQWPKDAHVVIPKGKIPISLRVDADILEFFKSYGSGYLSRMNAVLRAYMNSMHKKKTA